MQRRNWILVAIILVAAIAIYLDLPSNPGIPGIQRDVRVYEGLDLQGGMQVMLEADLPPDQTVTADSMEAAKAVIENRINGLGVSEPLIQTQGDRRIIVELPGIKDPDLAIQTFGQTGLLEFIDAGDTYLPPGTVVETTGPASSETPAAQPAGASTAAPTAAQATTPDPAATPAAATTPDAAATPAASATPDAAAGVASTDSGTGATPETQPTVYKTIMTGKDLRSSDTAFDPTTNAPQVGFTLTDEGAKIFGDYTSANVGKYLAIVMDKKVISCPIINSPITEGRGVIEGKFTLEEVRSLVIQLKYGALPVPLKVVENRTVGATLGEDSVQKSLLAGIVGLAMVILFMVIYYRIPGLVADIALIIYAAIVFALFKLIPVTLTVPGIAGFILSIGMAVDANILIFERTREELRAGKTLGAAIEAGFGRAWTSIRDSNVSTIITCIILYVFGMEFGASIIKGFALTLGIGVVISMFTAIIVTRTFLRVLVNSGIAKSAELFSNVARQS